ncbi:hypothetical protein JCM21142_41413 [Saccharicrinis fermentans DSM 9555 = JCM 21142]|uniref:Uncharacterized protein n=1 Tax=Saccharicrinis fermentans DSM 9555 = JCM 21142 TaxID=869213 RepID=W7YE82_9BACT|nr:hypothetical protein JCM21142_41413 [Saccharicrinis fermentans DSM 9555 = JCM 21142]
MKKKSKEILNRAFMATNIVPITGISMAKSYWCYMPFLMKKCHAKFNYLICNTSEMKYDCIHKRF